MPTAKLADVITPIAASAPIDRRRDHAVDQQSPTTRPQTPAPRKKLTSTARSPRPLRRRSRATARGRCSSSPEARRRRRPGRRARRRASRRSERVPEERRSRTAQAGCPWCPSRSGTTLPQWPTSASSSVGVAARRRPACRRAGAPRAARRRCARARRGVMTSCGEPRAITSRFRHTSYGRCAAMPFRSWVVSTIARPSWCSSWIRCITSWRVRTSTPARRLVEQQQLRLAAATRER